MHLGMAGARRSVSAVDAALHLAVRTRTRRPPWNPALPLLGACESTHRVALRASRRAARMRLCSCCTVLIAWVLAMASTARRKRGAELPAASSSKVSSQKEAKLQDSPPTSPLTPSQKAALQQVAEKSKRASDASLAALHVRLTSLGLSADEVKQRAQQLLTFVELEAPLIAYVPYDVVGLFSAGDPFMRNQFETLRSRGTLSPGTRTGWERAMFGGHYDGAPAVERVKCVLPVALKAFFLLTRPAAGMAA